MMKTGIRDRSGGVDIRSLLTILAIAVLALGAGFAIGLWLGS